MNKQQIRFKLVGQSADGKPLYELDNSTLHGQRPLPEEFRATVIFLPPERPATNDSKTYAMPQKTFEMPQREFDMPEKVYDEAGNLVDQKGE